MITAYLDKALRRARYREVDPGVFCATVPGLEGVLATGPTLEACRDRLAQVIEEWILVRVARGLRVPPLGGARIEVKRRLTSPRPSRAAPARAHAASPTAPRA